MLDPLTALSVASKEYYRSADGVLADHAEQAAISSKLGELSKQISHSISVSAANKRPSAAELALQEVTVDCIALADDFTDAINSLKVSGPHRKWKSFRQALKSVWKKEELEERLLKLDRLRQQVMIHLLVVVNDGQSKAFRKIEDATNTMESKILLAVRQCHALYQQDVQQLRKDMSKYDLKNSRRDQSQNANTINHVVVADWMTKNESTLLIILRKVDETRSNQRLNSYRQNIMDSLWFQKIDDRQNMIDSKHRKTLNWIFEPSLCYESQWASIPEWLRGPHSLYWVSGKAGSGKSTLMKWLFHDSRTRAFLREWACQKQLLLARYYFWLPGKDQAQKSLSGLLRSILYDLLQHCPDLILDVFPSKWRSYDLELAHSPAATDLDLINALHKLITGIAPKACVCFFIDGLDEFDGMDHQRLSVVAFLKQLSEMTTVKICVSSRTWQLFERAFTGYPQLRLQDLTLKDIEEYVTTTLQESELFNALRVVDESSCLELISEIISKAQGVWLWVILVVRSLLRGLQYEDSVADLKDRLREVPPELEDYFLQMFSSIEAFYRPKALRFFKIALNTPHTLSLMSLSFHDEWERDPEFVDKIPCSPISEQEIEKRLSLTANRLNARCLGLLETISKHEDTFGGIVVEFLHRTARDFIADGNTQKKICMDVVDEFNVDEFMCKSLLAQLKMLNRHRSARVFAVLVDDFMAHAVRLEALSSDRLMSMLYELNEVVATDYPQDIYMTRSGVHPIVRAWTLHMGQSYQILPLSIQFGLRRYAREVVRAQPTLLRSKNTWRPLLDLALRRQSADLHDQASMGSDLAEDKKALRDVTDEPDVELVRIMLENDADPNEMILDGSMSGTTVWKAFLNFLGEPDSRKPPRLYETAEQRRAFIEAAELCIRYGAMRVLNVRTEPPKQSTGRTRVVMKRYETLARDSFLIAFGQYEADRLDSLSARLNYTGVNLTTKLFRTARNTFW